MTEKQLRRYVEHCRKLVREINFVLADEQLERDDWEIVYAVDFSEIRAYVLPDTRTEPAPFRDGWAGWATEEVALTQFYTLERFFTTKRPLVLPQPYAVELRAFHESLPYRIVSNVAHGLLRALKTVSQTLSSETGRQILDLAQTEGRDLTESEIKSIIDFFQEQAANLVVFARGGELKPFERLEALLKSRPFIDLDDYVPVDTAHLNDEIVQRRFEALKALRGAQRPASASFLDALALEHLRLANEQLKKKKKRILLLARSPHMLSVTSAEPTAAWGEHGPIIRHPRVFSNTYRPPEGIDSQKQLPSLERRKASLELLISSATSKLREMAISGEASGASRRDRDPISLIEQIQTEWNVTDSLATALTKGGEEPPRTHDAATAATLLAFLRDHKELFNTAQSRVADMLAAMTRKQEILAFELQSDPGQTTRGDIRYRFEFNDPGIHKIIDRLVDKSFVTASEATELFSTGLLSKTNYERLLAMAVSLGALGRWQLAEQAAGRAAIEGEAEKIQPHEAHFLKAVAIRKQPVSPQRIVLALADLDAASEERERAIGSSEPDPRYLKEKATIQLIWTRRAADPGGADFMIESLPTAQQIENLLEQAKSRTTDKKLQIEILNNFCYLFATPPTVNVERAQHYLSELETTLAERYSDRNAWPSSIRDTVVYTNFRLAPFDTTPIEVFETWARELEFMSDADFTRDDRRWVNAHRSEILEAVLRKRALQQVSMKQPEWSN